LLKRAWQWAFSRPERAYGALETVAWWELRRIPFNLLIAAYGFPCLLLTHWAADASSKLQPGEDAIEPIALMLVPVAVNVFFTLGWLVEAPVRIVRPSLTNRFGPRLLMVGLGFGLLLCSLPAAAAVGMWLLP
jgi:hypothetical protein